MTVPRAGPTAAWPRAALDSGLESVKKTDQVGPRWTDPPARRGGCGSAVTTWRAQARAVPLEQ